VKDELAQYLSASGIRVVLEHTADTGSAGATLVIGAGTSDDDAERAGLAHLTEHLVFDAHRDGQPSLARRLEALGAGAYNGTTAWDSTCYAVFAPQQTLQDMLFGLAGVLREPLAGVTDADLTAERQIVKNEARFRSQDGSPGQAIGWLMEAAFPPRHPYARSGAGKAETLDRITLGDVRAFASRHYVPDASTLVVQSPLPIGAQRALVERMFGGIPAASAPPKSPSEGALDWRPSGLREHTAAVAAPVIWIGWSLPGVGDEAKGMGTFLEQFLSLAVEDAGYPRHHDISRIARHYIPGVRASLLALEVSLKDGNAPKDAAQAAIIHTLGALSALTHVGFVGRRYNLASSVAYEQEGLVARGLALARAAALFQDPGRVRQRATDLMALDESTLADYAAKYLTAERAHVVLVRPLSETASREQAEAAPTAGQTDPQPSERLPAVDVTLLGDWMKRADSGVYHTRTLPNGLNVVIVPRVKAPFHTVLLGFHGGTGYGARGAGIATLWSRLTYATSYDRGLESRLFLNPDSLTRGLRGVGRDLSTTLSTLRDSIMTFQVRWPPQSFVNQIERFEREERTPEERLGRASRQALLGTHPYAAVATVADMRQLSAIDVLDWLNNVERPENAELVIVGDFEPNSAVQLAEEVLGDWDNGHAAPGALPAPPALGEVAPGGSRLIVAHAPSASQAKVEVGCVLPPAQANDWAAYDVFRQMLASRLFNTLRTQIGASYSVSGAVELLRGGTTLLHISADVDPLRLQVAFREIRAFASNKATSTFDDQSLEQARYFVAAHYNLGLDTSLQAAQRVLLAWRLDWPLDTVTRYPRRLLDVHYDQVLRIAEHCRANWVVSVLGDETKVRAAWAVAGQNDGG
jgi:zinc protease